MNVLSKVNTLGVWYKPVNFTVKRLATWQELASILDMDESEFDLMFGPGEVRHPKGNRGKS